MKRSTTNNAPFGWTFWGCGFRSKPKANQAACPCAHSFTESYFQVHVNTTTARRVLPPAVTFTCHPLCVTLHCFFPLRCRTPSSSDPDELRRHMAPPPARTSSTGPIHQWHKTRERERERQRDRGWQVGRMTGGPTGGSFLKNYNCSNKRFSTFSQQFFHSQQQLFPTAIAQPNSP